MGYLKRIGIRKFRIVYDLPQKDGKRKQKTETLKHVSEKEAKAILAKREETIT